MKYRHLNQVERYQIHSLMKTQHTISQIAELLDRNKSTIRSKLRRDVGFRGYRPKQAVDWHSRALNRAAMPAPLRLG